MNFAKHVMPSSIVGNETKVHHEGMHDKFMHNSDRHKYGDRSGRAKVGESDQIKSE